MKGWNVPAFCIENRPQIELDDLSFHRHRVRDLCVRMLLDTVYHLAMTFLLRKLSSGPFIDE